MNQTSVRQEPKSKKKLLRRSTLLLTFCIVVVPWFFIALPGVTKSAGGSTGVSAVRFAHGWPVTFLERQTVQYSGTWTNGVFLPGAKPVGTNPDSVAEKNLNSYRDPKTKRLDFDLRLQVETAGLGWSSGIRESDIWPVRFWTSLERWPWFGGVDGQAYRWIWQGLLIDLLTLLLISGAFACWLEFRVRNGRSHFSISLLEGLFAITLLAIVFGLIGVEYRRATREHQIVSKIDAFANCGECYVNGTRTNGLPAIISQLLDHRTQWPGVDVHLFRPVTSASISVDPSGQTQDHEPLRLGFQGAVRDADFPISMQINVYRNTVKLLAAISDAPHVVEMEIDYMFDLEWDDANDSYLDDIVLDFQLRMPGLKKLVVRLHDGVDQQKQLKPFVGLPNLKTFVVYELNDSGIQYLMSIREQLARQNYATLENETNRAENPEFSTLFPVPPDSGLNSNATFR